MEDCSWREATKLLQLRGIRTVGAMFAHLGKPRDGVDCKKQAFLTGDSKIPPPAPQILCLLRLLEH